MPLVPFAIFSFDLLIKQHPFFLLLLIFQNIFTYFYPELFARFISMTVIHFLVFLSTWMLYFFKVKKGLEKKIILILVLQQLI